MRWAGAAEHSNGSPCSTATTAGSEFVSSDWLSVDHRLQSAGNNGHLPDCDDRKLYPQPSQSQLAGHADNDFQHLPTEWQVPRRSLATFSQFAADSLVHLVVDGFLEFRFQSMLIALE